VFSVNQWDICMCTRRQRPMSQISHLEVTLVQCTVTQQTVCECNMNVISLFVTSAKDPECHVQLSWNRDAGHDNRALTIMAYFDVWENSYPGQQDTLTIGFLFLMMYSLLKLINYFLWLHFLWLNDVTWWLSLNNLLVMRVDVYA